MKQLVSIIIPTYNRAHLIGETLMSIQNQTYQNWECIVVDDFSTDNTKDFINNFNNDKRIKYINKPLSFKKGANSSRNLGFQESKGDFILWFDSDDIMHPEYLYRSMEILIEYQLDFCKVNWMVFFNSFKINLLESYQKTERMSTINVKDMDDFITNKLPINTISTIWKKTSIGSESFNEKLFYADEWEFYCRLISNGLTGIALDEVLIFVRKHQHSTTSEFYANDVIRRTSKKEAIALVIENLYHKKLLSKVLLKYLLNSLIAFRDFRILKHIFKKVNLALTLQFFYFVKYFMYPFWKIYKQFKKK